MKLQKSNRNIDQAQNIEIFLYLRINDMDMSAISSDMLNSLKSLLIFRKVSYRIFNKFIKNILVRKFLIYLYMGKRKSFTEAQLVLTIAVKEIL